MLEIMLKCYKEAIIELSLKVSTILLPLTHLFSIGIST